MDELTRPIGLFDSGIGGLSVARHVMGLLPFENTVYFGDTARVPYGSKSPPTVIAYARQAVSFLEGLGVKIIVIACNTASAHALPELASASSVPVIGVIEPGAEQAINATKNGVIGVIGTEGTIRANAYGTAISNRNPSIEVHSRPCPLLVAFAEEGLVDHQATRLICQEYLDPLIARHIDTLILGCTHYPILTPTISRVAGTSVTLIDPGVATASMVHDILKSAELLNPSCDVARHEYFLSDLPLKFIAVGEQFLGRRLDHVHHVAVDNLAVQ